jgi:hypothetical protein
MAQLQWAMNKIALPILEASINSGWSGFLGATVNTKTLYRIGTGLFLPGLLLGMIQRRGLPENEEDLVHDLWISLIMPIPIIGPMLWTAAAMGIGSPGEVKGLFTDVVGAAGEVLFNATGERFSMKTVKDMTRALTLLTGVPSYPIMITEKLYENILLDGKPLNESISSAVLGKQVERYFK